VTVEAGTAPVARAPSFLQALRGIARRGDYDELLDQPGVPIAYLSENLAHLRLLNRWLGWSAGLWPMVRALLGDADRATLLDVATGSGDVPRDLARRALAQGTNLRLVGSDVSAAILLDAGRQPGPAIELVRHDATAIPCASASVDIATLCLAAHHLDPPALRAALGEMWRVSRRGIVVSDLERGRLAYIAARLMALVLRNPLTSHDGPVSVLRAYTEPELRRLAHGAGLRNLRVVRRFPFRLILTARKEQRA